MRVPVAWWTANPESIARGYWDQALLEGILDRSLWRPPSPLEFSHHVCGTPDGEDIAAVASEAQGAVVVVPGAHNAAPEFAERLAADLRSLSWWLLVVTGDEERSFPLDAMPDTPAGVIWTTSARASEPRIAQALGFGLQPAVLARLRSRDDRPEPAWEASFVGQDTHERRHQLVRAMRELDPDRHPMWLTSEFGGTAGPKGEGLSPEEYADVLLTSRVVPAPSGPLIPDSFRLFEALEAGAVPLADSVTAAHGREPNYWDIICGESPPFPVVVDWKALPGLLRDVRASWPAAANRAQSWWQRRKRSLTLDLDATCRRLSGCPAVSTLSDDELTAVISTSPAPAHPDPAATLEVIASVRAQLPHAEILVAADGVRPEQAERTTAYEEYLRHLMWATRRDNVVVFRREVFRHQALTVADAMAEVRTPLVLFLEHDTPLVGPPLDWSRIARALHGGQADLIRLHHESRVLEPHEHLMVGPPSELGGLLARPTAQWSQRPHVARTLWYRSLLSTYFGHASRTMIEDVMHGVCDYHWRVYGEAGWEQFRLWLLHEPDDNGSIQRSTHLDGRGDDIKYPMKYAYDGPRPEGAPAATRGRR